MRNYFHQNETVWGRHGIDLPRKSMRWGSSQLACQSSWGEGFIENNWVKTRVEHVVNMLVWKHVCTRFGATREGWADPRSVGAGGRVSSKIENQPKLLQNSDRRALDGFQDLQKLRKKETGSHLRWQAEAAELVPELEDLELEDPDPGVFSRSATFSKMQKQIHPQWIHGHRRHKQEIQRREEKEL